MFFSIHYLKNCLKNCAKWAQNKNKKGGRGEKYRGFLLEKKNFGISVNKTKDMGILVKKVNIFVISKNSIGPLSEIHNTFNELGY